MRGTWSSTILQLPPGSHTNTGVISGTKHQSLAVLLRISAGCGCSGKAQLGFHPTVPALPAD